MDDIRQLAASHRKFQKEAAKAGGRCVMYSSSGGMEGAIPSASARKPGRWVVEDHDIGGVYVLAPSFERFLASAFGIDKNRVLIERA